MNAKAVQMSVVIQMGFRKIPFEKGPRPPSPRRTGCTGTAL